MIHIKLSSLITEERHSELNSSPQIHAIIGKARTQTPTLFLESIPLGLLWAFYEHLGP